MTKFNPLWQLTRVKARKIKNYKDKLKLVLGYLEQNPNVHDYARVHNWLLMTAVGYKNKMPEAAMALKEAADKIEQNKALYNALADNGYELSDFTYEELRSILEDLEKRKYGFQFKSTPKAHIEFVDALKKQLATFHTCSTQV
jgi:hypothetical protein